MAEIAHEGWSRRPRIIVMTILALALITINAIGIWDIVSSRRNADSLALEELKLQAKANALSVEAVIFSRRGDFVFLSQSSPLATAPTALTVKDPIARKWGRLEIEGSLLLFMVAHPEVERLVVRTPQSSPLVVAGRRDGAPVLLPIHGFEKPTPPQRGLLVGSWPLGSAAGQQGTLEAVLDVSSLLQIAVPAMSSQFSLREQDAADNRDSLPVSIPISDEYWPTPVHWTLVCEASRTHLLESVTALADRYRASVILNLVIMSLALVVGLVGFQQMRRTMVLEEQNRQQSKVRELERQVMHNERLASIGRLAAGMAHEINNPLEGMSNYLALLEADLRSGANEGSVELAGRVREGLDRVAGIIRQILNFADPGSAPHASLDLNDILEETTAFVRSNPSFRQIEVVLRRSQGDLPILGNRVTLGQLFLNLLINACQAQPDGGQVQVASSREDGRAVVLVADCGPGMPPEVLPRIFEPFYSTRGSTGLGLFVCHGIVEEHSGRITAQNRMGGGALFQIEFPLHPGPSGAPERSLSHEVAGSDEQRI